MGWDPGDEPTTFSTATYIIQARTIGFTGLIENLQNQELSTFTGSKGDDDLKKSMKLVKFFLRSFNENTEFNASKTRIKNKVRPNRDLRIDLSGTPILGFDGLSANSNGLNKLIVVLQNYKSTGTCTWKRFSEEGYHFVRLFVNECRAG